MMVILGCNFMRNSIGASPISSLFKPRCISIFAQTPALIPRIVALSPRPFPGSVSCRPFLLKSDLHKLKCHSVFARIPFTQPVGSIKTTIYTCNFSYCNQIWRRSKIVVPQKTIGCLISVKCRL